MEWGRWNGKGSGQTVIWGGLRLTGKEKIVCLGQKKKKSTADLKRLKKHDRYMRYIIRV